MMSYNHLAAVTQKKKKGKVRFCVDYRKLNQVTSRKPILSHESMTAWRRCQNHNYFQPLTQQAVIGKWRWVAQEDCAKTAFCTTEQLNEFKVMSFSLCNATATFHRLMMLFCISGQLAQSTLTTSSIIIMSSTFEEHLRRTCFLEYVMQGCGSNRKSVSFYRRE